MNTADALNIHLMTVHKEQLKKVANAKEGRDTLDIAIYGMQGVPEDLLIPEAKRARTSETTEGTTSSATNATVPPTGLVGIPPGVYPPFPPMPPTGLLPYGTSPFPPTMGNIRPPFPGTTMFNPANYSSTTNGLPSTTPSGYPNPYPGTTMMPSLPRPGMPPSNFMNMPPYPIPPNQVAQQTNNNMNISISMSLNAARPPMTIPSIPTITTTASSTTLSTSETSTASVPSTTLSSSTTIPTSNTQISSSTTPATTTPATTGPSSTLVWNQEYLSPEEARASLNRYKFDRKALELDIENRLASILGNRK